MAEVAKWQWIWDSQDLPTGNWQHPVHGWLIEDYLNALEARAGSGCPCLYTTPCSPRCTCVLGTSSEGCKRCARYGSQEQKEARAQYLSALEQRQH